MLNSSKNKIKLINTVEIGTILSFAKQTDINIFLMMQYDNIILKDGPGILYAIFCLIKQSNSNIKQVNS